MSPGALPAVNLPSMPSSTARPARRFSSSSGRNIKTSMPATIRATLWSVISGKACLQNWKKTR